MPPAGNFDNLWVQLHVTVDRRIHSQGVFQLALTDNPQELAGPGAATVDARVEYPPQPFLPRLLLTEPEVSLTSNADVAASKADAPPPSGLPVDVGIWDGSHTRVRSRTREHADLPSAPTIATRRLTLDLCILTVDPGLAS